ncbi:hypothetical protein [Bacillus cereus]|uniref:hypothetical protein n=1 Tax=Bacillus cereus TaxID=1396 RepID=UPI00156ABD3E|nr:hypothetical protein [Bacillus cereus]UDV85185.1 hypothetical protein HQJ03_026510 [Bacillus cereus]UDV90897.1 hypothetical protein HQG80_027385 [Bacillus cereus]HDV8368248.1 hypothetical protein [Bacillus cereus]
MGDVIGDVLGGLFMFIPSKREKVIRKNFKLLEKEVWFKEIEHRYGRLMVFNHSIRDFVANENLEDILKDVEKTHTFLHELEKLLQQEKI